MLKAFDPLVLHLAESFLGRKSRNQTLSFGESLEGTRDILLVASRDLSDLLALIPAARALRKRFRMARVHALATGPAAEVLAGRPEIFGVLPWIDDETPILSREFLDCLRAIKEHEFDLAIAVDGGQARLPRLAAALSGAKLRLGVHPEGKDATLNLVISAKAPTGYAPVQSLEFLSFLGIPREELTPHWEIPQKDQEYARRLIELRRRGREGWLLGVDPGLGRSGVRPSPEKIAWLVDRLVSARGAVPVLLTSEPTMDCAEEIRGHMKSTPLELSTRGIRDVLSFTRCCDVFLAGNTSLFHLAVAMGVPSVGLFSAAEDERWCPEETSKCRLLRWKPGERVSEGAFVRIVDDVRRSRVLDDLPETLTLADDLPSETAVDPS
ncbi:MAG: hypothetical protein DHS20C21_12390 [Gemmatimonadota bacterium]|nr:MAG: hypothetical protein DHS20C21_12390 [Gemmatimonadota bacterium]